jgi:hypothetical protein
MMTTQEAGTRTAERSPPEAAPGGDTAAPAVQRGYTRGIVRHARRLAIGVIGSTVVLIGIALLVLPGPAIVVIPLGLAILATEFVWAKRLMDRAKEQGRRGGRWVQARWRGAGVEAGELPGDGDGGDAGR